MLGHVQHGLDSKTFLLSPHKRRGACPVCPFSIGCGTLPGPFRVPPPVRAHRPDRTEPADEQASKPRPRRLTRASESGAPKPQTRKPPPPEDLESEGRLLPMLASVSSSTAAPTRSTIGR